MEASPGACRAAAEGHEAAGYAMGQAGADRPCQAPTRRGRLAARVVAGFQGRRNYGMSTRGTNFLHKWLSNGLPESHLPSQKVASS
ncbi:MAG: DUF768 domain-containing protein [Mesorhizobium sp.]|nr:DUF768 domain-containing protein [Mesorhizobium sp. M6A.T.Cr.TU.016.01.1.1]RWP53521.1 MAG: DUF768 domain-containing protein [Mesorhizobium sp.]